MTPPSAHPSAALCAGLLLLAAAVCHTGIAAGEEAVVVDGGRLRAATQVGRKWTQDPQGLSCAGVGNFLVAAKCLGDADFTVRVRMSLAKLNATAASLMLGGDHFGLDGGGGRLFVEGPTFGKTRLVGDAAAWIKPGEPFDLAAVRKGDRLTFRIGGKDVWGTTYRPGWPVTVALRPWRAAMHVHSFVVAGSLADVPAEALRKLTMPDKKPTPKPPRKPAQPETPEPRIAAKVTVAGVTIDTAAPPEGLVLRRELGLVTAAAVHGKLLHVARKHLHETRATITPGGDYLLMFPEGSHYGGSRGRKVNDMMALRSADRGKTWSAAKPAFDIDYSQHGFVPLTPKGTKRIYAFGTQPIPSKYTWDKGLQENAPIGFRWSNDDGHTWSKVSLIKPVNDPTFRGMSVMRMCATDAGTWIIGAHEGDWSVKPLRTRQYLLRSEDRGKTWTVLPDKRPNGWFAPSRDRMDEGRPISLGRGEVFAMFRTPTGFLWSSRSTDDGKTWAKPAPTPLVHPDAPPMLFLLADGKTLAALHHNRFSDRDYKGLSGRPEVMKDRSEIWVALSRDGGRTWTEPRFVLVNALADDEQSAWHNYQCSYIDAFTDGGRLHLFMPHRWKRALYLTLPESALDKLPTKAELAS